MAETSVNNGVNVDALLAAREVLKTSPEAAKFKWRASCKWQNGTHSKTKIQEFHGLGAEQKHKTEFSSDADHPEIFASEDLGATPIEFVLVGLASCLTAGVAAVAQKRDIQLRSVKATIEGDMNVLGILGADPDVRNGFSAIRYTVTVRSPAPEDKVRRCKETIDRKSPVLDVLTQPVKVSSEFVYKSG